jgi:hypothetical protein
LVVLVEEALEKLQVQQQLTSGATDPGGGGGGSGEAPGT